MTMSHPRCVDVYIHGHMESTHENIIISLAVADLMQLELIGSKIEQIILGLVGGRGRREARYLQCCSLFWEL